MFESVRKWWNSWSFSDIKDRLKGRSGKSSTRSDSDRLETASYAAPYRFGSNPNMRSSGNPEKEMNTQTGNVDVAELRERAKSAQSDWFANEFWKSDEERSFSGDRFQMLKHKKLSTTQTPDMQKELIWEKRQKERNDPFFQLYVLASIAKNTEKMKFTTDDGDDYEKIINWLNEYYNQYETSQAQISTDIFKNFPLKAATEYAMRPIWKRYQGCMSKRNFVKELCMMVSKACHDASL